MNIIACIKQVPDTETVIKITADGKDIESQGIKYIVNPYDEYAVEEAVRLKDKNAGSSVTVLSIGPARTKDAIRTCLAMGADRAIHLCDEAFLSGDTHLTARVLAAQIKALPTTSSLWVNRQSTMIARRWHQLSPLCLSCLSSP